LEVPQTPACGLETELDTRIRGKERSEASQLLAQVQARLVPLTRLLQVPDEAGLLHAYALRQGHVFGHAEGAGGLLQRGILRGLQRGLRPGPGLRQLLTP